MRFKIYGKFEIPLEKDASNRIDKADVKAFWQQVEQGKPGLPNACGVYIFGIEGRLKNRSSNTSMLWYIGKAEKQTFKQECFTDNKLNIYNNTFFDHYMSKGSPFLYLMVRQDEEEKFSTPTTSEYPGIRFVEKMFIQMGLSVNGGLKNVQNTDAIKTTAIKSVMNWRSKESEGITLFKKMFEIGKSINIISKAQSKQQIKSKYDILGPFEIPLTKGDPKKLDEEDREYFWHKLRDIKTPPLPDIHKRYGVYVIATQRGKSTPTPWYIGVTESEPFLKTCMRKREEIRRINEIASKKYYGTPKIFFLPRLTKKGALANEKSTLAKKNIEFVKDFLLEYGLRLEARKHSDFKMLNKDRHDRTTKMLRNLEVEGFVNSKKYSSGNIKDLKKLLGISD